MKSKPLIEELAELEHEQWCAWAHSLSVSEKLSRKRIKRWHENMLPYDELPDEIKEYDRVWARKILKLLRERGLLEHK